MKINREKTFIVFIWVLLKTEMTTIMDVIFLKKIVNTLGVKINGKERDNYHIYFKSRTEKIKKHFKFLEIKRFKYYW